MAPFKYHTYINYYIEMWHRDNLMKDGSNETRVYIALNQGILERDTEYFLAIYLVSKSYRLLARHCVSSLGIPLGLPRHLGLGDYMPSTGHWEMAWLSTRVSLISEPALNTSFSQCKFLIFDYTFNGQKQIPALSSS